LLLPAAVEASTSGCRISNSTPSHRQRCPARHGWPAISATEDRTSPTLNAARPAARRLDQRDERLLSVRRVHAWAGKDARSGQRGTRRSHEDPVPFRPRPAQLVRVRCLANAADLLAADNRNDTRRVRHQPRVPSGSARDAMALGLRVQFHADPHRAPVAIPLRLLVAALAFGVTGPLQTLFTRGVLRGP